MANMMFKRMCFFQNKEVSSCANLSCKLDCEGNDANELNVPETFLSLFLKRSFLSNEMIHSLFLLLSFRFFFFFFFFFSFSSSSDSLELELELELESELEPEPEDEDDDDDELDSFRDFFFSFFSFFVTSEETAALKK